MALDKFGPNAFATGSVTSDALATGTIATEDIADDAITYAKWGGTNLGRRNLIINGDMQVAQRGSSFTYTDGTSGYKTMDRWYAAAFVTGGSLAISRQSANNIGVDAESFLRATPSGSVSAGSATIYSEYRVENIKQFHNKQVTLSFYVKASSSLTFQIRRHHYFGGAGSTEEYTSFSDVPVTTSWTRHTVTFPAQDFSSKSFSSGNYFGILFYWSTDQGSNQLNDANIDITNVQLEFGDTATPFEHRSYGEELLLCQRYYWTVLTDTAAQPLMGYGAAVSSTRCDFVYTLPVCMRTTPSVSNTRLALSSPGGTLYNKINTDYSTGYHSADQGSTVIRLGLDVSSGLTSGDSYFIRNQSGTGLSYIYADAEL